ncbi:hypothetical protein K440DRAFT_643231 [Wilcoxina mikolae CBS 423.85]|nr:hypothetical protein K440DRAFT_643231 [Wilcoxina mikolae CBS 423.85]
MFPASHKIRFTHVLSFTRTLPPKDPRVSLSQYCDESQNHGAFYSDRSGVYEPVAKLIFTSLLLLLLTGFVGPGKICVTCHTVIKTTPDQLQVLFWTAHGGGTLTVSGLIKDAIHQMGDQAVDDGSLSLIVARRPQGKNFSTARWCPQLTVNCPPP